MTITTTLTIPVAYHDLHVAIFGSGAFSYSWYEDVDVLTKDKDGDILTARVRMETADETKTKSVVVNTEVLAQTIQSIINEQKPAWQTVLHAVTNEDFDADAGDIVLQYAVLGDLVFG